MKRITIIIPVYNVKKDYLIRCFDSICIQNYRNIEVIIIDDGSEKECASICDEYKSGDDRIIVIHQKNSGAAFARNVGIQYASGDYILFLDADDWLLDKDTCTKIAEMVSDDIDIEFFSFVTNQISRMKRYQGDFRQQYSIEDLLSAVIRKDQIAANIQVGAIWSKLFRTEFLRKHNIQFDINLRRSQDRLFMLNCLRYSPVIGYEDYDIMCFNTQNDESLSRGYKEKNKDYLEQYFDACEKFVLKYYGENTRFVNDIKHLYIAIYLEICYHVIFHPLNNREKKQKKNTFVQYTRNYFSEFVITDELLCGFDDLEKNILKYIRKNDFDYAFSILYRTTKLTQIKNRIKKEISNIIK